MSFFEKRIPINEEGYEYPDPSRSLSSNLSPQGNGNVVGPLSTRTQLNSKNFVQQQNDFPQNNFRGKTKFESFLRLFIEKDQILFKVHPVFIMNH